MSNELFRAGGAGFIGDLVRMGGDPRGSMTNDEIANSGAGMWHDLVRMGGDPDGGDGGGDFVIPEGYPNAENTGYTGELEPMEGGITITVNGTTIVGKDIDGHLIIDANDVSISNCRIRAESFRVVYILPTAEGCTIDNCELDGMGVTGQAILGQGQFLNNNIHNCADGIVVSGGNTVVNGNYIHDFASEAEDPHYDGIDVIASDVIVLQNTVLLNQTQTSACSVANDDAPQDNVTIEGNYFAGGGHTLGVYDGALGEGNLTNCKIKDNLIKPGAYSPMTTDTTGATWINNINEDTDELINDGTEDPAIITAFVLSHGETPGTSPNNGSAINLGVVFRPMIGDCEITAVYFYKRADDETTAHDVAIWAIGGGAPLATGSSTGEATGAAGWIRVELDTPLAVVAGTFYVASYLNTNGKYSATAAYFTSTSYGTDVIMYKTSDLLPNEGNGRFDDTNTQTFPNTSFGNTNYFVDIEYTKPA